MSSAAGGVLAALSGFVVAAAGLEGGFGLVFNMMGSLGGDGRDAM
ncbi:hypothetical protein ACFVJ4_37360 [Streptomyces sp. NPDC127178]